MDEVNASISANAEQEELVDQPLTTKGVVRVSGPFTVEAVQPPEMSLGDAHMVEPEFGGAPEALNGGFEVREVEVRADQEARNAEAYLDMMIRLLRTDGVRFPNNKQANFSWLMPVMDGSFIHSEGSWATDGDMTSEDSRAEVAVAFGPQYGPVTAKQVEEVIRQASRRGYDHLVIAGFSFDGAARGNSRSRAPEIEDSRRQYPPRRESRNAGVVERAARQRDLHRLRQAARPH
jgi:adenine-specific DNA-methyltransferase